MFPIFKLAASVVIVASWSLTLSQASAQESDSLHTWTNSTGEFKVEGSFEKLEDGKVFLKRVDSGEVIAVPLTKLSKEDQAHVRKLLADKRKASADTAPSTSNSIESPAANVEGEQMVWQGTWNNRKFGTEGSLKCVAQPRDSKTWDAKFDGIGLGKPFKYQVTIETSKKGDKTLLQGTSNVDGDTYRWTGVIEGEVMSGKYRSMTGNNGEFRLQATNTSLPVN